MVLTCSERAEFELFYFKNFFKKGILKTFKSDNLGVLLYHIKCILFIIILFKDIIKTLKLINFKVTHRRSTTLSFAQRPF